jgi:hypothetical protein
LVHLKKKLKIWKLTKIEDSMERWIAFPGNIGEKGENFGQNVWDSSEVLL